MHWKYAPGLVAMFVGALLWADDKLTAPTVRECLPDAIGTLAGPPPYLVEGLTMPSTFYGVKPEDIPKERERQVKNLRALLLNAPLETLTGVEVYSHPPDTFTDPRAIVYDPVSLTLTIDLRYVPEYLHPYVRRIEKLVKKPIEFGGPFGDVLFALTDARNDPASPLRAGTDRIRESLGDYTRWTNQHRIEKSESNGNRGRERHFFRNEDGTRSVSHTLSPDGTIERREILAVVDDGHGGKRLVAQSEERDRQGKLRRGENRTCLSCHFISKTGGAIVTRLDQTNTLKGRSPNLRPIAESRFKPSRPH